ncbi:unnamed protein product, partial [Pylaiella littoralis]
AAAAAAAAESASPGFGTTTSTTAAGVFSGAVEGEGCYLPTTVTATAGVKRAAAATAAAAAAAVVAGGGAAGQAPRAAAKTFRYATTPVAGSSRSSRRLQSLPLPLSAPSYCRRTTTPGFVGAFRLVHGGGGGGGGGRGANDADRGKRRQLSGVWRSDDVCAGAGVGWRNSRSAVGGAGPSRIPVARVGGAGDGHHHHRPGVSDFAGWTGVAARGRGGWYDWENRARSSKGSGGGLARGGGGGGGGRAVDFRGSSHRPPTMCQQASASAAPHTMEHPPPSVSQQQQQQQQYREATVPPPAFSG